MKIHFIAFGTKNPYNFTFALERIKKEAINSNFFDNIKIYQPKNLDVDFQKKYQDILSLKRGYGYWLWKIQIIKQRLSEVSENDIVIYLDAGSSINKNGKEIFNEYIKLLNDSDYGFLAFSAGSGRSYIIQELIDYFHSHILQKDLELTKDIIDSHNFYGGHLIIQKNNHSKLIIDEFFKVIDYDPYIITDKYNDSNIKYPEFLGDSRHDQSIFSLLFKVYGCVKVNDPHYFGDRNEGFKNDNSKKYPFLAVRQRKRTNQQMIKHNRMLLLFRKI
tara:strand:- start:88 stop:912 length:825 start_codon:yes stop_codon:yes gene_type:complete